MLLLIGCFLGGALRCYRGLLETEGQNGFYNIEETLTREQMVSFWEHASEMTKRSVEEMVFFRQEENTDIQNAGLNRTDKITLIEAAGNMNLIAPGKLTAGNFAANSDMTGCVVSRAVAEILFGAREAVGETVFVKEKNYIIRGVLNYDKPLCVIQGDSGTLYSHVRVKAHGIPLSVLTQMLGGIINTESTWISEGDLYIGIGRIALFLPLWGLFVRVVLTGRTKLKKCGAVGQVLFPVLVFSGVCILLLVSVRFSDDYVPSMWSDFAFWTQLIEKKAEIFLELIQKPLQIADAEMLKNLAGVIVCGVGGLGTCTFRKVHVPNRHNPDI